MPDPPLVSPGASSLVEMYYRQVLGDIICLCPVAP